MKRIAAIVLSMILILTYIPGIASAEEASETPTHLKGVTEKEEGTVYGTSITYKDVTYYYTDLKSAIADASPEDVIKLEKSFAISAPFYISAETPITIDLAGYTITSGSSRIFIGFDGTNYFRSDVTLDDSVGGGKIISSSSDAAVYVSSGKFTVSGGSIINSYNPSGAYAQGIYAKRLSEVNINGGTVTAKVGVRAQPASVTMTGGEIKSTAIGVFLIGSETEKASFSMSGGNISCGQNVGVYTYSHANVEITGGEIEGKYGIQTKDSTDITVNGGNIGGTYSSLTVGGNSKAVLNEGNLINSVIVGEEGSKFVMNGGKVISSGVDAAVITNDNENGGKCNVIINGGEILSDTTAMYLAQPGTVTVKGGRISGSNGITVKSGQLNISPVANEDLTIEAKGAPFEESSPADNKSSDSGAAVAVIGNADNTGDIRIDISGGNFKSDYGMAMWIYEEEGTRKISNIKLTGGSFTGGIYNQNKYNAVSSSGAAGFIRGGNFNTNVSLLAALGYTVSEAEGRWNVSDGVTFRKETSDVKEDLSGNSVTTITSEGKDAQGNSVSKTVTVTAKQSGEEISKTTETIYSYTEYTLCYKEQDKEKTEVKISANVPFDSEKTVDALVHASSCARTNGASAVTKKFEIKSNESSYAVSKKLLEVADCIEFESKDGKFVFTKAAISCILEDLKDDTFVLSAESYDELKDARTAEAKQNKVKNVSVSKKDSKITVNWDKPDNIDGYIVKLLTEGKTYEQIIDSSDASTVTFPQKVSKSYRIKIASYTVIDGEKTISEYTSKTVVASTSVTAATKNSLTSKVTVKWKKLSSVDGYRVQLVTNGKTTTKYVKGSSYTFTPKVTKAYRVKVAAYSVFEGKKVFSQVKTVTKITKPEVKALSKSSSGKVTVKWKKLSSVNGYRIKLNANDKTYTKTITKNSTVSYTFSQKVKGKYTVSIASYAVIEGNKVYTADRTYTIR